MVRPPRTFAGSPVRLLGDVDLPQVWDVLRTSPIADVFVASRVEAGGLAPGRVAARTAACSAPRGGRAGGLERWRLGAERGGQEVAGPLVSVCYAAPISGR